MPLYIRAELCLVLLFLAKAALAGPVNSCEGAMTVRCPSPGKRIIEVPDGLIDGQNNVFRLAVEPRDASDLRLFSNGSELAQGSEYQIVGREIRISAQLTPAKGGLLQVSYVTPLTNEHVRGIGEKPSQFHSLTRAVLLRSLGSASTDPPQPAVGSPRSRSATRTFTEGVPRSGAALRLLTSRMYERQIEVRSEKAKRKAHPSLAVVGGFEGTGDVVVPNPFQAILDPGGSNGLERSLSMQKHLDASAPKKLRSFSLLEQRLNSQTATDEDPRIR